MNSLRYMIIIMLFGFVGCSSENIIAEPQPSSEYIEYLKKLVEGLTDEERKQIREQLIADKERISQKLQIAKNVNGEQLIAAVKRNDNLVMADKLKIKSGSITIDRASGEIIESSVGSIDFSSKVEDLKNNKNEDSQAFSKDKIDAEEKQDNSEIIKLTKALVTTEQNLTALKGDLLDDPYVMLKQLEVIRWYKNPMFVMCDGIPWIPSDKMRDFNYLTEYKDLIRKVSKSVGMIQLYHKVDGDDLELVAGGLATALAIDSNHIITNAHVLQESDIVLKRDGKWVLPSKIVLKVIFPNEYEFCEAREAEKEIVVTEIVDFNSDIDYVILKTDSQDLAPILMIADKVIEGDNVVVMGYPSTPNPGQDGLPLTFEQISRIYSTPDDKTPASVLRLSPGRIIPKDRKKDLNTYRHDASTWGASSGSIVMRLKDGAFVGLHQGGMHAKKEGVGFNFAIIPSKIPFLTQKVPSSSTH